MLDAKVCGICTILLTNLKVNSESLCSKQRGAEHNAYQQDVALRESYSEHRATSASFRLLCRCTEHTNVRCQTWLPSQKWQVWAMHRKECTLSALISSGQCNDQDKTNLLNPNCINYAELYQASNKFDDWKRRTIGTGENR